MTCRSARRPQVDQGGFLMTPRGAGPLRVWTQEKPQSRRWNNLHSFLRPVVGRSPGEGGRGPCEHLGL